MSWSLSKICVIAALAALSPAPAVAGEPPAKPADTPFECRWADAPISIDGKLDEPNWKTAQLIDRFTLPWLREKERPARTATKARLLWDRESLYFAAEMEDADLFADVKEHDGRTWENDVFELFFKPADDKPGYYEFQVNAAGTVMDMFLPRRGAGGYGRFKDDGEFHLVTRVVLRGTLNRWQDKDTGWTVEGRIPWNDFLRSGGRPAVDERWKFALCRYDYSVEFEGPELSTCAPLATNPTPNFHYFEDYATLRFVGPNPKQAAAPYGIRERVALTTSRVVGSPDPPPPFRVEQVYPRLKVNFPIAVVRQPASDRLWFIAQDRSYSATRIHRMKDDPQAAEFETLLTGEDTAYDIVFHPQFAENGYVFVGSNGPGSMGRPGSDRPGGDRKLKHTRVTRYTLDPRPPYAFDPATEKLIIEWPSDGHNGGAMAFGQDGMLYVTSGDGTSDSDTNVVGQDMTLLVAKVLRIDVDRPDPGRAYSVPRDNPFVGMPGARPETWAYGLRNPWRIAADARTGHIWVGNNGQDQWEQIYFVRRGDNCGWSVMEGSHPFYLTRTPGPTPFVKPALEHPHSEARSLTGGIVYYGRKFPELRGAYIYGDYSTGKIWGARHDGERVVWHKELADSTLAITGFGTDSQGEILICDHRGGGGGGFFTLAPSPGDAPPATFPRTLSESGLFRSVQGHVIEPALIPYSVNSPLWSDGAYKERYLALPGDDPSIEFHRTKPWELPEQTVLVKSFALEIDEGNGASRRWIETRFLTKQEGEWVGYSYAWNDEQTDAVLVAKEGMDREYVVRTAAASAGMRKQTWRFPSRTECMVCHSRAANYVLGLNTPQMNREHDYGGVRDNQLRTLEALGLFRVNYADDLKTGLREATESQEAAQAKANDRQVGNLPHMMTTRMQREPRSSTLLALPSVAYPKLADPYDVALDLGARARSYLHANCAQCHVPAGGGNAQFDVEFSTKPDKVRLIDARPVHHTYGIADARLVAPGDAERSILLARMKQRGAGHMPPLATSVVDEEAVRMLEAWIRQLPEVRE